MMKMKIVYILLAVLFMASLAISPGCAAPATPSTSIIPVGHRIGERAPDFNLFKLTGEKVSLGSYLGRPVMVNFWATD
jgi:hypothetical protein